jgi:hypothetical protein
MTAVARLDAYRFVALIRQLVAAPRVVTNERRVILSMLASGLLCAEYTTADRAQRSQVDFGKSSASA